MVTSGGKKSCKMCVSAHLGHFVPRNFGKTAFCIIFRSLAIVCFAAIGSKVNLRAKSVKLIHSSQEFCQRIGSSVMRR